MGKYSEYKGVSKKQKKSSNSKDWYMQMKMSDGKLCSSHHNTEREAALAYDKKCLEMGLEPVNILVPKI